MQPINRFCGPPAHATKWTVVVDRPREARTLLLFDTQAEVHAEIIRLRERGVAHVFALAPVVACSDDQLSRLWSERPDPDSARAPKQSRPASEWAIRLQQHHDPT